MFVMVMSVCRLKNVFHTETVSKDKINVDQSDLNNNSNNNNLVKNINCINNHLQLLQNSSEKKNYCNTIDKTILSPSALAVEAAAQNSAQNSTNKFLLTELNNYRKTPITTTTTTAIQVSAMLSQS